MSSIIHLGIAAGQTDLAAFILTGLNMAPVVSAPATSVAPVINTGIGPTGFILDPPVLPRRIPLQAEPLWIEYFAPPAALSVAHAVRAEAAIATFRTAGLAHMALSVRASGILVTYSAAPATMRLETKAERRLKEENELLMLGLL